MSAASRKLAPCAFSHPQGSQLCFARHVVWERGRLALWRLKPLPLTVGAVSETVPHTRVDTTFWILSDFLAVCLGVFSLRKLFLDTPTLRRAYENKTRLLVAGVLFMSSILLARAFKARNSSSPPLWSWYPMDNCGPVLVFAAFLYDILTIRFPSTIPGLSSTLDIVCRFVAVVSLTYGFQQSVDDAFSLQYLFTTLVFIVILVTNRTPPIPNPPLLDENGVAEWRNAHIVSASWWQQEDLWRHCFVIAELRQSRKSELREDGDTLFVRVERNKTEWLASSHGNPPQSIAASRELTDLHHQSHRVALIEFKDSTPRTKLYVLADLITMSHLPLFNCWWFAQDCFLRIAIGRHPKCEEHVQITVASSESSVTEWLRDRIQRRLLPDGFKYTFPAMITHLCIETFRPQVHLPSCSRTRFETLRGFIVFCERWNIRHFTPIKSSWTYSVYLTIMYVRWFCMTWRIASISGSLYSLRYALAADILLYVTLNNLSMALYSILLLYRYPWVDCS
ncbi:hypothetical protein JAAARDRAFT_62628 [Jaapia argillacea MUCL 33604]|uniref:Uncharacterized protein n=1 Tax=Jaapia argillacea MUCL 33604 TaxID=933084 RepID=A0A067PBJ5_9AGAM|nr:hypothetical protein JAAARDRAFT_62628 [Jaapia argillacea MUCL 33604]